MIFAWLVFFVIIYCSFKDIKRTIIVWSVCKVLFNAQIALIYSPGLALTVAVDVFLFFFFLGKCYNKEQYYNLNNEPFILKNIVTLSLASYIFSMLFGVVPLTAGLNNTIKYFFCSFGCVYLVHKVLNTREDIALFIKVVVICSFLISALGIYESIFHDNPFLDYVFYNSPHNSETNGRMWYVPPGLTKSGDLMMRYGMVRCYSFFGIHIQFGCTCLFFLYLINNIFKGVGGFIDESTDETKNILFSRKWLIAAILLLVLGVFVSNSKTPLVGLFLLVFALYEPKKILNLKIMLPLFILVTALLIFMPNYFDNISSLFDEDVAEEGGGSKMSTRENQLDAALAMLNLNPIFGNGIGSVGLLKHASGNFADILGAESSWFQILPERGLFGALIYLYSFIFMTKLFTRFLPLHEVFMYLLTILVMESATGFMNMSIWLGVLIAVRRIYCLNENRV